MDKIEDYIEEISYDCFSEIEGDYNEEELKDWNKLNVLEYMIEYLDLELQSLMRSSRNSPNLIKLK